MAEKISAAESMARVFTKVHAVGKDSRNQQQGFNYRGVDAVVNAVHPVLAEVGGFLLPTLRKQEIEHATTSKGNPMVVVRLRVEYAWYGTDGGEPIRAKVSSEAFDTADKATAKAWSVALRTYLLQALLLPTDEPDPDDEYLERGRTKTRRKPANAKPEMAERVAKAAGALRGAQSAEAVEKVWSDIQKSGLDGVDELILIHDQTAAMFTVDPTVWDTREVTP